MLSSGRRPDYPKGRKPDTEVKSPPLKDGLSETEVIPPRYVIVTMEGYSMGSRHHRPGIVAGGIVKIKPGFRKDIFNDDKPEDYYDCDPMTAAACRSLTDITEDEYKDFR